MEAAYPGTRRTQSTPENTTSTRPPVLMESAKPPPYKVASLMMDKTKAVSRTNDGHSSTAADSRLDSSAGDIELNWKQMQYAEHAARVLDYMNRTKSSQKLCDVIITTDGGQLQAHRVVLGAASRAISAAMQSYAVGDVIKLDLTDFKLEDVDRILQFIYTAQLNIDDGCVGQVLGCARKLGIKDVVRLCIDYLNHHCDVSTALLYYAVAVSNELHGLKSRIYNYIVSHFYEIASGNEILHFPAEWLHQVLSNEQLVTRSEVDIFDTIVKWVSFDRDVRISKASSLLECVRFDCLTLNEFTNHVEPASWMFNEHIWKMVYFGIKRLALTAADCNVAGDNIGFADQKNKDKLSLRSLFSVVQRKYADVISARVPQQNTNTNCAVGQEGESSSSDTEEDANSTVVDNDFPKKCFDLCDVSLQDVNAAAQTDLYSQRVTGVTTGRERCSVLRKRIESSLNFSQSNRHSKKSERRHSTESAEPTVCTRSFSKDTVDIAAIDPVDGSVSLLRAVTSSSSVTNCDEETPGLDAGSVDDEERSLDPSAVHLTAFGGIDICVVDDGPPGRLVSCYKSAENRWETLSAKMAHFRHHYGVVVLNEKFYIVGGCVYDWRRPGSLGVATNDVQLFDLTEGVGKWSPVAVMQECRAYLGVASWEQCIFAVGGEDENKRPLDSVECYELKTGVWKRITRMPGGPRLGISTAVLRDFLFVVGGLCKRQSSDRNQIFSDVERYDITTDSWCSLSPLCIPRCFAGLVEVSNQLYLVGGQTSEQWMSVDTVEQYQEDNDEWETVAEMCVPRCDAACCSVEGQLLYIIGGMTLPKPFSLRLVECLNVTTRQWCNPVADYPFDVTGLGCGSLRPAAHRATHKSHHLTSRENHHKEL